MGVSPNFVWAPSNFGWHPEACLFELFVLVFSCRLWSILLIGRDSCLSSVEMFEIFKVSCRILKVLSFESSIFYSQIILSLNPNVINSDCQ